MKIGNFVWSNQKILKTVGFYLKPSLQLFWIILFIQTALSFPPFNFSLSLFKGLCLVLGSLKKRSKEWHSNKPTPNKPLTIISSHGDVYTACIRPPFTSCQECVSPVDPALGTELVWDTFKSDSGVSFPTGDTDVILGCKKWLRHTATRLILLFQLTGQITGLMIFQPHGLNVCSSWLNRPSLWRY